ncbi:MAG: leucyl aminopeptidase family protein [Janthinobacterium lividum]
MTVRDLDCLADDGTVARPVHAVRPDGLDALLEGLAPAQAGFLRDSGEAGAAGRVTLLPGGDGVAGAVLGLGTEPGFWAYGALPFALPEGSAWRLEPADGVALADAALGFCLGAYRFAGLRTAAGRGPARLVLPEGAGAACEAARSVWLARDLINTPANLLGPHELAEAARAVAEAHGARFRQVEGEALAAAYPAIAAVGAGSDRAPVVAVLEWRGSGAGDSSPLVSLCGKGVVFDTGGLDLKPSAGMLRMKKDMGGAAILLALARLVMASDLPLRLELRLGCVENSVSGRAMRPMDVLQTRKGLSVEVGNTDAEGRLVLCDLLAEACEARPDWLIDAATLTGAARVAVGPDLPALFSNDDAMAEALLRAGTRCHDPMWRLPLWAGYDGWLSSQVADLGNVSSKPFAGAVTAALFLQRFVPSGVRWAHLDAYAWNDSGRPGRPEGGEAQTLRAAFSAISSFVHDGFTTGTPK